MGKRGICESGEHADNLQLVKTDDVFLVEKVKFTKSYLNNLLDSSKPEDKVMLNLVVTKIVKNDHKDSFEYLLDRGYKIDVLNDQNQTAIHLAVYNNADNILEWGKDFLLSKCSDNASHVDGNGLSYLHFACMAGRKNAVKKFLNERPDVNARWYHDPQDDRDGFTPLHFAVANHKTEIVKFLLHYGADVNSTDSSGRTPLHLACCISRKFSKPQESNVTSHPDWNAEMKIIKLLVAHDADLNLRDKLGNTPLLSIFKNDKYRREIKTIDEKLVENRSKNVKSLLKRQKEKLDYLMERGVDITMTNDSGENILHRIIGDLKPLRFPISYETISFDDEFHAKLIGRLLSLGCGIDINEKNSRGETPLLFAIAFLSLDIVKVLLDHDADMNDLKFNYQDKNFFNYPAIYPNLKATRNLFSIIDLLTGKGFKMTLQDQLALLKFLVHEVHDCECRDTSNFYVLQFNMMHAFFYGSAAHVNHVSKSVKLFSEGTEFKKYFHSVIVHNTFKYLKLCKIAKMDYPKEIYRDVKDNCCSLEKILELGKVELAGMKYIVLENNVTLYDLLIMDLDKINYYVKNHSQKIDKIVQQFFTYRDMLEGRMTRSMSLAYFFDSSRDYLRALMSPSLPNRFCEKLRGYLSCHDLLNACLAAVEDDSKHAINLKSLHL